MLLIWIINKDFTCSSLKLIQNIAVRARIREINFMKVFNRDRYDAYVASDMYTHIEASITASDDGSSPIISDKQLGPIAYRTQLPTRWQ